MEEQKSFISSVTSSIVALVSSGMSGPNSLPFGKREGNDATAESAATFLFLFCLTSRPQPLDFETWVVGSSGDTRAIAASVEEK